MKIETVKNGGVCTPLGFTANSVIADVKGKGKGNLDFALLMSDQPLSVAGVFTTNLVKAAPVRYSMDMFQNAIPKYGVMVNSGNANACTGAHGIEACKELTEAAEKELGLPKGSLYIASTGVIGEQLPVERMLEKIPELCKGIDDDKGLDFAKAILTTDKVAKEMAVIVHTDKGSYTIGGACKGAGMMDPAMCTLLGFITTDVNIDAPLMRAVLREVTEMSFNSITVDGDRSTNDSLYIFANGMSDVSVSTPEDTAIFKQALFQVCHKLALDIVRDGEGSTKLVTINVKSAKTDDDAHLCAAKIANSLLVKTMFAGCDPNWGRLMATAGSSGAMFEEADVSIWFNSIHYVRDGIVINPSLEKKIYEIMKNPEYTITLDLGAGAGEAVYYTCDITKEYVAINADYRS